jgi:hypothetical protein
MAWRREIFADVLVNPGGTPSEITKSVSSRVADKRGNSRLKRFETKPIAKNVLRLAISFLNS